MHTPVRDFSIALASYERPLKGGGVGIRGSPSVDEVEHPLEGDVWDEVGEPRDARMKRRERAGDVET